MPSLSIIIINYNTPELTERCVDSVLSFTELSDFEVIIVDNGSSKRYLPNTDSRVKYVYNRKNLGFSGGNNLGLTLAMGEYILLLNSDTIISDNSLKILLDEFISIKNCGAITPKLVSKDGSLQFPANRCPGIGLELRNLFRINKFTSKEKLSKLYLGSQWDYDKPVECDWIYGTCFLTSRQIINEVLGGKFPDRFFMYAEDMQWSFKLKKAGLKLCYTPKSQIIHLGGASMNPMDEEEKYFKYMLPNTFDAVAEYKGRFHAKLIVFCRILLLLSLFNKNDRRKAFRFWKFLKN
ncbi:MAG: glycosyltransferase family 2 protein [Bacteroidales bacterium]|nr:glycosyltransferase family 2 protein [Bacteroidales bacterium]